MTKTALAVLRRLPPAGLFFVALLAAAPALRAALPLPAPSEGERIVLIGNALAERMQYYGHFETQLHLRFPDRQITVRNMGHSGDTPAYRPRASRPNQWAFPGGEKHRPEYAQHLGQGHLPSEDEWLTQVGADTILAFFGFNESFDGLEGVDKFAGELSAFVDHTLGQPYNGRRPPRLVLVSPIAFEDLSSSQDLPDGRVENTRLERYTAVMRDVAATKGVGFIDLFSLTRTWYAETQQPLTINGAHLSEAGYRKLAPVLVEHLYGPGAPVSRVDPEALRAAVNEKSWYWLNDYRMINGVHVYGRRHRPFGNINYPHEILKIREMTLLRDAKIWTMASENRTDVAVDDSGTYQLPPVETNFQRPIQFLERETAVQTFTVPEGFKIELFAAESDFPDLKNPVQMTFDNRGRLWVAVMSSYPHYRPGDPLPDDKLIIFEDTDKDGRADKQTIFARGLHLPIGFELAPEGVYLTQQPNLVLLRDTNGDDQADQMDILLHGFDSHDSHHAISAYTSDARGAIYLSEGRFLHSQVETPYGPVRCNDGGVFRFDPRNWRLERFSQYDYNNPWGISFDDWGQNFIADASSGNNLWMLPLSLKLPFGIEYPEEIMFTEHRVRPTSGTEFISSRHFPDEVQGDFLLNNTIGFLGTKQHAMREDGSGFRGDHRQDLVASSDPNYRPVDLEFGPDGSLFILDWHNPLVGHMQHNARDPNRDHDHGRIYRVIYPSRALVKPAVIAEAPVATLLENLKSPEYRTRYRTHRELRGRPAGEVLAATRAWVASLDADDPNYERHLLEGLWVTWGQNRLDLGLLERALTGKSHHLRAAATRVLRHEFRKVPNHLDLLLRAAGDDHGRVRLEAIVAASWIGGESGARILVEALNKPLDRWMENAAIYTMIPLKPTVQALVSSGSLNVANNATARDYLERDLKFGMFDVAVSGAIPKNVVNRLGDDGAKIWATGREIYSRDGHCTTCHQSEGQGVAGIYPPLARTEWVNGPADRVIKIVLHGLMGEITVNDVTYAANLTPPMPGFGGMLNDAEIAAVVTYVRNSFGNNSRPVTAEDVSRVRAATTDQVGFYQAKDLATPAGEGQGGRN